MNRIFKAFTLAEIMMTMVVILVLIVMSTKIITAKSPQESKSYPWKYAKNDSDIYFGSNNSKPKVFIGANPSYISNNVNFQGDVPLTIINQNVSGGTDIIKDNVHIQKYIDILQNTTTTPTPTLLGQIVCFHKNSENSEDSEDSEDIADYIAFGPQIDYSKISKGYKAMILGYSKSLDAIGASNPPIFLGVGSGIFNSAKSDSFSAIGYKAGQYVNMNFASNRNDNLTIGRASFLSTNAFVNDTAGSRPTKYYYNDELSIGAYANNVASNKNRVKKLNTFNIYYMGLKQYPVYRDIINSLDLSSVVIGYKACNKVVSQEASFVLGYNAVMNGSNSSAGSGGTIAIGHGAAQKIVGNSVAGEFVAIGIGANCYRRGIDTHSISIGAFAGNNNEMSVGGDATRSRASIAIGQYAISRHSDRSIAIGYRAVCGSTVTDDSRLGASNIGIGAYAMGNTSYDFWNPSIDSQGQVRLEQKNGNDNDNDNDNDRIFTNGSCAIGYKAFDGANYVYDCIAIGRESLPTFSNYSIGIGYKAGTDITSDPNDIGSLSIGYNTPKNTIGYDDSHVIQYVKVSDENIDPASGTASDPGTLIFNVPDGNVYIPKIQYQTKVTNSDIRLKNQKKKESKLGLKELEKIKVYEYTMKSDKSGKKCIGVIAQEVKKVVPFIVHKNKITKMLAITPDELFFIAFNALKQINIKIKEFEKDLSSLEMRVYNLEIMTNN